MKILLYVDTFLSHSTTFIFNQLKVIDKNIEVKVICRVRQNEQKFPYHAETIPSGKNFKYYYAGLKRKLRIDFSFEDSIFEKSLTSIIEKENPDLIYTHFGWSGIKIYNIVKRFEIPLLITYHGNDASEKLNNKSYVERIKKIMNSPSVYGITVSQEMKQNLKNHGICMDRTTTLHLGIDTSFFQPIEKNNWKKQKIFLQVSNFVEKKGHIFTIEALNLFFQDITNKKKYKVILAGDGPLREGIISKIKEYKLENYISCPGLVSPDEVNELMGNADYFLHHSVISSTGDKEGIPTVIMEAMGKGLPVVTTYHSGIPELVRDHIDGFLVEEKDIKTYSRKLYEVTTLDNSSTVEYIKENFDIYKNSEKLVKFFKKIISEKNTNK